MTVREFATKYSLPLAQVKAAMHITKTGKPMVQEFEEEELLMECTRYYLDDMRGCIRRAAMDDWMLRKMSDICHMDVSTT